MNNGIVHNEMYNAIVLGSVADEPISEKGTATTEIVVCKRNVIDHNHSKRTLFSFIST